MNFKEEILIERKKRLGLDTVDTKKVFETMLEEYKKEIIKARKEIVGYSISLTICNMNGYNRLGALETLYKNWGDNNYYVDINNSCFLEMEINEEGEPELLEDISFKKLEGFENVKDIAFSLKEFIELCKENNFMIRIYAKDDGGHATTLSIDPYKEFKLHDTVKKYLDSLEK